jgi:hypothetical protein
VPRSQVLDGLEAALDEDRAGWAPEGSTLEPGERTPAFFARYHSRLRLAAVRYVLSFRPLPEELVSARGEAVLPEVLEPLRLYELRDPLPRAFTVARFEVERDPQNVTGRLEALGRDPRDVVLLSEDPPPALAPLAAADAFVQRGQRRARGRARAAGPRRRRRGSRGRERGLSPRLARLGERRPAAAAARQRPLLGDPDARRRRDDHGPLPALVADAGARGAPCLVSWARSRSRHGRDASTPTASPRLPESPRDGPQAIARRDAAGSAPRA